MSENEDDSSKTEEPSDRKLKKAHDKGDVPISRDVGHLMGFAGLLGIVFLLIVYVLPGGFVGLWARIRRRFHQGGGA